MFVVTENKLYEAIDHFFLSIDSLKKLDKSERAVWLEKIIDKKMLSGTHISKGIHTSSTGDCVHFDNQLLSNCHKKGYIGTHILKDLILDFSGNGADINYMRFFHIKIGENYLFQLLEKDSKIVSRALKKISSLHEEITSSLSLIVNSEIKKPLTREFNKQILWPLENINSIDNDSYICIVPLYPSVFCYEFYKKIQLRNSKENKENREKRRKKTSEKKAYFSMANMAFTMLGGSNARNIGELNQRQFGRHYLLPSMPPTFEASARYLPSKNAKTIFNQYLTFNFLCRDGFSQLMYVVDIDPKWKNVELRDKRKDALNTILLGVFGVAKKIIAEQPPNWSEQYSLNKYEKAWLDPFSESTDDDEPINYDRWITEIKRGFAIWVNQYIKDHVKDRAKALQIDDVEALEWRRVMDRKIRESIRKKEGLFNE